MGPGTAFVGLGTPRRQLALGGVLALRTGRAQEGMPEEGQLNSTSLGARLARDVARAASAHALGASLIRNAQSTDQSVTEMTSHLERTLGTVQLDATEGALVCSARKGGRSSGP